MGHDELDGILNEAVQAEMRRVEADVLGAWLHQRPDRLDRLFIVRGDHRIDHRRFVASRLEG